MNFFFNQNGNVLLSRAVSRQVSSALRSLTSVFGMGTGVSSSLSSPHQACFAHSKLNNLCVSPFPSLKPWSSLRPISTFQLNALLHLHLRPINVIVSHGSYALRQGDLFLWGASYLDAFSTYPVHTWLPSYALGSTTGAPEVCPSRSSRTKNSSTQISNAHSG